MAKKVLPLFILLYITACAYAQQQIDIDFKDAKIIVEPIPLKKEIKGSVSYNVEIINNVDSVFLDAVNTDFHEVLLDKKKVKFINDGKRIIIKRKFKKGKVYNLSIKYSNTPTQAVYFIGWHPSSQINQIWTQGQGKYTSNWLPSLDDMNDKIEFDLSIIFNNKYKVVANGKLISKKENNTSTVWNYDMKKPMSSYLLAFAIGDYDKKDVISASGIPMELYYYKNDSNRVEPTYRYSREIFDFLENEIQVPYPWQNYKQIPVRDFLYAGMENTGTTIFSDAYMIDSVAFDDKNYVNVNAHELAHQWFGDLVTEKNAKHHWLHEGFATYYALLTEREIFGKDYFFWKLYDTAVQLNDYQGQNKGEALNNPKASSLTFYEKGAWALQMLRDKVGDKAFKIGVKNYLDKHQLGNVVISDFFKEVEKASGTNLSYFKTAWIEEKLFPTQSAIEHLKNSSADIKLFLELKEEMSSSYTFLQKEKRLKYYWNKTKSEEVKARLILGYPNILSFDILKKVLNSKSKKIRRALVNTGLAPPTELKDAYKSLLEDESYYTIESALYILWQAFPKERNEFLEITKNHIGMPNKNVRLLWLTLALLTPEYQPQLKETFHNELTEYTDKKYSFEVRQGAFQFLNQVFGFTEQNLKDLVNASVHHSWQFKKSSRNLLEGLLKDEEQKKRLKEILKDLSGKEFQFLNSKLNN